MNDSVWLPGKHSGDRFSPTAVDRELETFQTVLGSTVTRDRLDRWTKGSDIRAGIVANTVWGTIRWRKGLGRPTVSVLANAFVIEHRSWQEKLNIVNGVGHWVRIIAPHDEPSKWDGPEDDEWYRVSFMSVSPQLETRIRVDFAPHVAWERNPNPQVISGYNDIEPQWRWFAQGATPRVLEPFEVLRKPFSATDG